MFKIADITTRLGTLEFKTPIGLASCSLGSNYDDWVKAVEQSKGRLGFIVIKSTSKKANIGFGRTYGRLIVRLPVGMVNAEGLPNQGMVKTAEDVRRYLGAGFEVPLIGSVFGFTEEDIVEVASYLSDSGVVALELNYSCPHSDPDKEGAVYLIGQRPDRVREITKRVRKNRITNYC